MIELKDITFAYSASGQQVLNGLEWKLNQGAVHGLLGFNGAGKTTLLNILAQVHSPDTGTVRRDAKPIHRKEVAYLQAVNFFYSHITGREYLTLFDEAAIFDTTGWNALFRLPLDDDIHSYSTGMKKKLAFLAVVKLDKDILILDEPFNGLDMEAVQLIKQIIAVLKDKGKTIVITSHVLDPLCSLCDHIHVLKAGRIQQRYDPEQFNRIEQELFSEIRTQTDQALEQLIGL